MSFERLYASIEAERDIAGSLLTNPLQTLKIIRGIVCTSDFEDDLCRRIYSAVLCLSDVGKDADPVIIQAVLEREKPVDSTQLASLMQRYTAIANIAVTAEIVRDAAIKRQTEQIGLSLASGETSAAQGIDALKALLCGQHSEIQNPEESIQSFAEYVDAIISGKQKPYLSTGFINLDNALGSGLVSSGLITVAARPGVGKSTVALNIAERVAQHGKRVLYISLEMPSEQIHARRVGIVSGLPFGKVLKGALCDDEILQLTDAESMLYSEPFYIIDRPCNMDDIERAVYSIDNLSLIIIDHIGLIGASKNSKQSRYEQITYISGRLKQLALATKIPIIALCQLNRNSEARESKRPMLSDLRDSGSIEQDSDVVILLFRESLYLPDNEKPKAWETQAVDLIIDKNRHAPPCRTTLNYMGLTASIWED